VSPATARRLYRGGLRTLSLLAFLGGWQLVTALRVHL
jgi:hypothetical protein